MFLNIIFFKYKNTLFFNYCLDNLNHSRKNIINDLSIIFYSKLSFKYHIDSINKIVYEIRFNKTNLNEFE